MGRLDRRAQVMVYMFNLYISGFLSVHAGLVLWYVQLNSAF